MLIHKLVLERLGRNDRKAFYTLQASEAIRWIEERGGLIGPGVRAIDLGCGHGIFGGELAARGCDVTFADYAFELGPELAGRPFIQVDLDRDDLAKLGQYDLVISSNVLEHLSNRVRFIEAASSLLRPGGSLYLSWTNWLSPWGGHEFSPFHYLGPSRGHLIYDRVVEWVGGSRTRLGRKRKHTVYENLFPTYIGETLDLIGRQPGMRVKAVAPRFYTELEFIMRWPVLREFLAWNCAVLATDGRDAVRDGATREVRAGQAVAGP